MFMSPSKPNGCSSSQEFVNRRKSVNKIELFYFKCLLFVSVFVSYIYVIVLHLHDNIVMISIQ
jgi:hypothetical protein